MRQEQEFRVNLFGHGATLQVMLKDEANLDTSSGILTNLSRSGMFLKTDHLSKRGKVFQFDLLIDKNTNICGRLHVCWNRAKTQGPYLPRGFGAQVVEFFEESDRQWFQLIEDYLTRIKLVDLCSDHLEVIPLKSHCQDAVEQFKKTGAQVLVVTDPGKKPQGILTPNDLIKQMDRPDFLSLPIRPLIQGQITKLETDDPIDAVFWGLKQNHGIAVPITEQGILVGVVTHQSLLPYWWETTAIRERRLKANLHSTIDLVAHDLRNPVNIVISANSMLKKELLSPEEYLAEGIPDIIHHNCLTLSSLIDDLLKGTSQEDEVGKTFCRQDIDFDELISQTCDQFRLTAQEKNITLSYHRTPHPIPVEVDPRRIEQVLSNLISNAVKYSHKDTNIELKLTELEDSVTLEVKDQGLGIPLSEQPFVFEKYCKISTKPTGGEQSTGLGLAISKRLIEAHGGRIHLQSVPGEGSTFTVTLPKKSWHSPCANAS